MSSDADKGYAKPGSYSGPEVQQQEHERHLERTQAKTLNENYDKGQQSSENPERVETQDSPPQTQERS